VLFNGYDRNILQAASVVELLQKGVGRRATGTSFGGKQLQQDGSRFNTGIGGNGLFTGL
jgi:hypothetical protein